MFFENFIKFKNQYKSTISIKNHQNTIKINEEHSQNAIFKQKKIKKIFLKIFSRVIFSVDFESDNGFLIILVFNRVIAELNK